MKKIILTMAVVFAAMQTGFAQTDTQKDEQLTPGQRAEQKVQHLDKKLSLTDEQETKIKTLYGEFYEQKFTGQDHKTAVKKLNDDILALLDDEQKAKFSQTMEHHDHENGKGNGNGHSNGKNMDKNKDAKTKNKTK